MLTRFRDVTYYVADFSDEEQGALGRCCELSYAVGVDGLTLSSKPSAVYYLDGLKPYYCNKFSFETFDVISV